MQIKINKLQIFVLGILLGMAIMYGAKLNQKPFAAVFKDVPQNDKNAFAIQLLADKKILKGFSDNTFRPKKQVKRHEFATFVKNLKNPKKIKSKKCFRDVIPKAPFSSAVCYLKELKVFTGERFFPMKPLKREDLIKSICILENWSVKEKTFNNCLLYAKKQKLLAPFNAKKLFPKKSVRRAELARFIVENYPNLKTENLRGAAQEKQESQKETQDTFQPFTPVLEKQINVNFFDNIILAKRAPNTFYYREVYAFEGDILIGDYDEAFVFLLKEGSDMTENFVGDVVNRHFKIPVIFRKPGNYQIGIIPGEGGRSKVADISILPDLPVSSIPSDQIEKPKDLSWEYKNGNTKFSWKITAGDFVKLVFEQSYSRDNVKKIEYFFREKTESFASEPVDFKFFKEGEVSWHVAVGSQTNWIGSDKKSIYAVANGFRNISSDLVISNFTDALQKPGNLIFKGKNKIALAPKAALKLPDAKVKMFPILEETRKDPIETNTNLDISIPLDKEGIYIFELNDPDGAAMLNSPVFVGNLIPLLPDFFAVEPAILSIIEKINLDEARLRLLGLLNAERLKVGVSAVSLDDDLNALAQNHANDMVKRNFFSHDDPDGKGPEDRRKLMRIQTAVKENLAKAPTLEYAHEGLARSPIHQKAMIEPQWTRVGIGIAKNTEGYLIIAQEFSTEPLTEEALKIIENDFIAKINKIRGQQSLREFSKHAILENQAQGWSDKMIKHNFFSFENPILKESLVKNIRNTGINNTIQTYILEGTEIDKLEEELLSQPPLLDEKFYLIGLGIANDELGTIRMTIIYGK